MVGDYIDRGTVSSAIDAHKVYLVTQKRLVIYFILNKRVYTGCTLVVHWLYIGFYAKRRLLARVRCLISQRLLAYNRRTF